MPIFRTNTSDFTGRPIFFSDMFDIEDTKKMSVLNSDNAIHAGIEVTYNLISVEGFMRSWNNTSP